MGEQDHQADLARARRSQGEADQAGERALAADDAARAEFASFIAWFTEQAATVGWHPVPLLISQAKDVSSGFLGLRSVTQFDVVDHPDIQGLLVREDADLPGYDYGASWLVTGTGDVYRFDDDGWFEEALGPVTALGWPDELTVKKRLRWVLLDRLAARQAPHAD